MSLQYSVAVVNAQLDALEVAIGVSPLLRLYSGAPPANCAAAASGTLLMEMALPSDWMAVAAARSKAKAGTWSGTGAVGAGTGTTVGHYRVLDSTGATCHIQGTVTGTGAGGDMTLDNTSLAQNQAAVINTFTISGLNA